MRWRNFSSDGAQWSVVSKNLTFVLKRINPDDVLAAAASTVREKVSALTFYLYGITPNEHLASS